MGSGAFRRVSHCDAMDRKPAPDRAALHKAALLHLSRYAATEAGLLRVLENRIARWAREQAADAEEARASYADAQAVARALVTAGLVDDAVFAAARARRLQRAGRSRRAVAANLAAKGVASGVAQQALESVGENEIAAALAYARTRRIGPFRACPADDAARRRELGMLARAGFGHDVALQALATSRDEADALVAQLKRG